MPVSDLNSIVSSIRDEVELFCRMLARYDKTGFEEMPDGKWSAGQNGMHLVKAIRPVAMALGLPKFVPLILFGKANRPSRSFEALEEKYNAKLSAGARASGPYIPAPVTLAEREKIIAAFNKQKDRLIKKSNRFSEKELDFYLLPHPLLGKVTLREMLFFTAFHIHHHRVLLEQRG